MSPNKNTNRSKKKSNKTLFLAIGIVAIILVGVAAYVLGGQPGSPASTVTPSPTPSPVPSPNASPTRVLLQTTAGNITLELRTDKPITTTNFVNLIKEGLYDGTIFHRVMTGFMIQGGKNDSATVATIPDEIGTNNRNTAYTIAMAKTSAPNSATSQFFINVADNGQKCAPSFDATYTVFGQIISGKDVVDAIANASATANPYNPSEISVPVHPVTVIKATVLT